MSKEIFNQNYDACVICSTLNQIVNYIPLKCIINNENKTGEIINITMESSGEQDARFKRFDNEEWDENLRRALKDEIYIPVVKNEQGKKDANCVILKRKFNFKDIIDDIEGKVEDINRILWNVTGGQRSTIMAIQEVVRKRAQNKENKYDDTVIYLEGNTNKLIVGKYIVDKYNDSVLNYEEPKESYGIEGLRIETALGLAGFKVKYSTEVTEIENKYKTVFLGKIDELISFEENDKEEKYNTILKEFIKLNKAKYFNSKEYNERNGLEDNNLSEKEKKAKKEERMRKFKEHIKSTEIIKMFEKDVQEGVADYLTDNFGYQARPFGYIFEEIIGYKLKNIIDDFNNEYNNFITDFRTNCVINFLEQKNEEQIDELDMVLLTKSGQFVIFECKSGTMSGDNAKSNKYTTYAIGSVYGKPILITPFTKSLLKNIPHRVYDPIKTAIKSAERAKMEVWGIDEISARLKNLFSDVISVEEVKNEQW